MELFFNKVDIDMFGKKQEMTSDDGVSLPILANTMTVFKVQSKEFMRVRKFVIKTEKPEGLWIIDIKIGNISQITPGCAGVPVETFLEGSPMIDVRMDSLEAMQIASICIENRSDETRMCQIMISDESPNLLDTGNTEEGEYYEVNDDDNVVPVEEIPKK